MSLSFIVATLLGTILLLLPVSVKPGNTTTVTDALFTAASAISTTGLSLYDTYTHWSAFGQCVILLLAELGGVGVMVLVTFFNVMIGRKLGLSGATEFLSLNIGEGLYGVRRILAMSLAVTFAAELIGAAILSARFVPQFGDYGIFMAFFASCTAFTHAGFDLMGVQTPNEGYIAYAGDSLVMFTMGALVFVGSLGFATIINLLEYRRTKKLTLNTRVVLHSSAWLFAICAVAYIAIGFFTYGTDTYSPKEIVISSIFTGAAVRTSGLVAIPLASEGDLATIFSSVMMFIGGAPGSMAGGIKVTTFMIIIATIASVIKGRDDTIIFQHRVQKAVVYKTLTVFALSLMYVFAAFTVVFVTNEGFRAADVMFEVVSAFTTTGYSLGICREVNVPSKMLLVLTMLVGRIGPASLMFALAGKRRESDSVVLPESGLMIG
jgi:trk system potassium uptake protein TrkH